MNRFHLLAMLNALALAGLQAASIGGTIYDPSNGALPLANVALLNPATGDKQYAASDSAGAFRFANLPPGQYFLQIDKAGFTPVYKLVTIEGDADLHPSVVLSMIGMPTALQEKGGAGPPRIRVGGNVQATNLIRKIQPVYPPDQKALRIQGTVSMKAEISPEGVPVELTVFSTPGEQLAYSSLEAVRQWRYKPTLLNGDPVEVSTQIDVRYSLAP